MTGRRPTRILVAGGGVAAVEAVAAVRALLGPLPHITMLAPVHELTQRSAAVAQPFGWGPPTPLALADVARRAPFALHHGTLADVDAEAHIATTGDGEPLDYDILLVAVGARPRVAVPGAITFAGADDAAAVGDALEHAASVAFVLPSASCWALPVYELAIMAAAEQRGTEITVVTPESSLLWSFGPEAEEAIGALLADRGIMARIGTRAVAARSGVLELDPGPSIAVDVVVALPRLAGPAIAGLPCDADGFIATDPHGRVPGIPDVYAAGDATAFPLKQGGLAAQQADAAAAAIAASLGAPIEALPFRPVLRGLLLTGGAPLYLRSHIGSGKTVARRLPQATVSQRALWWPPGKIAGRYLAPLLATARPPVLAASPLEDLPPGPPVEGAGEALELALLLASEDAAQGDYTHAVHTLDAAAALTGGVLPVEWTARRDAWLAAAR